jgi:uncharacterized protein (TIGR02058 family)
MVIKRLVVEMGQGVDLHGLDYTKAACRAVEDVLRHASLTIFRSLGLDHDKMLVGVQVGAQKPDEVDLKAVAAMVPFGEVTVQAEKGGLDIGGEHSSTSETDVTVMVTAAVIVSYDMTGRTFVQAGD